MSMTKDELLAAAMTLPPAEREAIAEHLLLSIADADRVAIDEAWLAESRRRDEAFARGEMTGGDVDDVLDRIRTRARQ